jgi:hypothetical protein
MMPFAVHATGDKAAPYTLESLTDKPGTIPTLSPAGRSPGLLAWYEQPLTMYNAVKPFASMQLHGFLVGAFAFDPGGATRPARLLTGYLVRDVVDSKQPVVLELHASQLRTDSLQLGPCSVTNTYCPAPPCSQDVIVPPSVSLDNALLEAWNRIAARWDAPVQIVGEAAPAAKRIPCPPASRVIASAT